MYKESSVDDVKAADIVQVIGNFIELKKKGVNYFATSPFSEDKTASFCVFPSTNSFKCFSSGIGGDGIKFVMLHKSATYPEALKTIADICRITLLEEEVSEEETRKRSYKQELFDLNAVAVTKYQMQLAKQDDSHWAKQMVIERGFTDETIAAFSIGYAPNDFKFLTSPFIESAKFELAKTVGLVVSKEGKSYDFFHDRIMFPIQDFNGHFVGFGGRKSTDTDGPKYVNSKETEIYVKPNVLYGLYQAKSHIQKIRVAVLVEGYTDVTGLHQHGCQLAIATGGTALSKEQCKLIKRFANHVIIFRDNDGESATGEIQKGTLAALRDVNYLLAEGLKVSVCVPPEGEDPDSMSRKVDDINKYIFDNAQDAVLWKTLKLKIKAANDDEAISAAAVEVAEMLFEIKDDIVRESKVTACAKLFGKPVTPKILRDNMKQFVAKAEAKLQTGKPATADVEMVGLPEGADFMEFQKKGFVTHGNQIWFRGGEKFFPGTNWRMTPLFHVPGGKKRICEIIPVFGIKKLVEFDVDDFGNMSKFESKLLDIDNFYFTPDVSARHFKMFRNTIMGEFTKIKELSTLGWHPKGFYAYSDCVWHNGITKKANTYGIVQLEVEKVEQDYVDDIDHFYLPSASAMHIKNDEGQDLYENDRALVYKQAPCSLENWMSQLQKVYGRKANTGIAMVIATCFRDMFISRYGFFPIMFLTGEKGSGKTVYGKSLIAFFTHNLQPFDLNSGTPVAFFRRLDRTINILDMFEEFHDRVDDKIFQGCKGGFDGRGREMGKATGDNRTQTTKVNSGMMITSQYLSSRDDNSLTTRSVLGHFVKPMDPYTSEEIEHMSILKGWEDAGINSMVIDVIKHRPDMEKEIHKVYSDVSQKMKKELKGMEYQERMLNNYVLLLTPLVILEKVIRFPFKRQDVWDQFKDAIIESSDLIIESEGLAEFWRMLEFMLDRQMIVNGRHFMVKKIPSLDVMGKKGEKPTTTKFDGGPKNILYLRLNAVYPFYNKEVSMRDGVDVIGENTLKNYFRSKRYFVGLVKSVRFDDTATSAYAFDYDMMHGQGILNLIRGADLGDFETKADLASEMVGSGDEDLFEGKM